MQRFFYKNFPWIALFVALLGVAIWSGIWFAQKAKNEEMMQIRAQNMGYFEPLSYKLRGFPSRYDFLMDGGSFQTKAGVLSFGEIRILTYPENADHLIVDVVDPINLNQGEDYLQISGDPLHVSIHFDDVEMMQSFIMSGADILLVSNDQSADFSDVVFAYDPQEPQQYGMRLEALDGQEQVLKADNFEDLLSDLQANYLQ